MADHEQERRHDRRPCALDAQVAQVQERGLGAEAGDEEQEQRETAQKIMIRMNEEFQPKVCP
ncbi:MAG: hypothetical protein ACLRWP_13975 [Bilophila wadsworthia]